MASGRMVLLMARLFGGGDPIQAGEFEIPKGASGSAVLDLLQHGRPIQRLITVTEGMPSIIIGEKLAANPYLTGPTPPIGEGSVLPDSYGYERGEARAAIVRRMQAAMTKTLDAAVPKQSGEMPRQLPTGRRDAGIDRRERDGQGVGAADGCWRLLQPAAHRHEARCRSDGHLSDHQGQADRPPHPPVRADGATGYNTYRQPGLPLGPIANPGAKHRSRAESWHTKAIYFVADGTGGHVFAETFQQQQANVQRWYAIRRQRGEM